MRMEAFHDMYGAQWRPLSEADGLPEWVKEIGKPDIVEGTMRVAVARIAARHLKMAQDTGYTIEKPRLGEVMLAYREVEAEATSEYHPPELKCTHCDNSGWCLAVRNGAGYYADPLNLVPRGGGNWTIEMVPCHCPAGANVLAPSNRQPDGTFAARPYPKAFRDRLVRYHIRAVDPGPALDMTRARGIVNRLDELETEAAANEKEGAAA